MGRGNGWKTQKGGLGEGNIGVTWGESWGKWSQGHGVPRGGQSQPWWAVMLPGTAGSSSHTLLPAEALGVLRVPPQILQEQPQGPLVSPALDLLCHVPALPRLFLRGCPFLSPDLLKTLTGCGWCQGIPP